MDSGSESDASLMNVSAGDRVVTALVMQELLNCIIQGVFNRIIFICDVCTAIPGPLGHQDRVQERSHCFDETEIQPQGGSGT